MEEGEEREDCPDSRRVGEKKRDEGQVEEESEEIDDCFLTGVFGRDICQVVPPCLVLCHGCSCRSSSYTDERSHHTRQALDGKEIRRQVVRTEIGQKGNVVHYVCEQSPLLALRIQT